MKYSTPNTNNSIIKFDKGFTIKKYGNISEEKAIEKLKIDYPNIFKWLLQFANRAKNRTDKGDFWWELRACDYYNTFLEPKIMYQKFQVKPCFVYDESGLYCNDSMWIIPSKDKGLLAVLNSKMGWWLISKYCTQIQNGYQLIWKYFGQIPIAETTEELAAKADLMLSLNKELQEVVGKFCRNLQREFGIEKFSKKLENWQDLAYGDFLKELKKLKIELSLSQKAEWEDYFLAEQNKAQALQTQIQSTDQEIDRMVYELYGLNAEEIEIVEKS